MIVHCLLCMTLVLFTRLSCHVVLFLHIYQLIPKIIRNRKKRLCVRLRSGDKHHLRKSADRKAQISPVSGTNASLICAFRSADFLRWYLSLEHNLTVTHNLFFLFRIIFGINLIHFFDEKKDGAAGNSIVFFFRCFDPLSRHLTEVKRSRRVRILRRMRTVSSSATFWQRKVWTQRHLIGKKLRCKFLARKVQNSSPIPAFWQGKVQTSSPISALLRWRHFRLSLSLSLSLSLCISLSLTEHTELTISLYRKRFRASYNKHNLGQGNQTGNHESLSESHSLDDLQYQQSLLRPSQGCFTNALEKQCRLWIYVLLWADVHW